MYEICVLMRIFSLFCSLTIAALDNQSEAKNYKAHSILYSIECQTLRALHLVSEFIISLILLIEVEVFWYY